MSKFTLMNKNRKILDFEYDDEEHIIVKNILYYEI